MYFIKGALNFYNALYLLFQTELLMQTCYMNPNKYGEIILPKFNRDQRRKTYEWITNLLNCSWLHFAWTFNLFVEMHITVQFLVLGIY